MRVTIWPHSLGAIGAACSSRTATAWMKFAMTVRTSPQTKCSNVKQRQPSVGIKCTANATSLNWLSWNNVLIPIGQSFCGFSSLLYWLEQHWQQWCATFTHRQTSKNMPGKSTRTEEQKAGRNKVVTATSREIEAIRGYRAIHAALWTQAHQKHRSTVE